MFHHTFLKYHYYILNKTMLYSYMLNYYCHDVSDDTK